MLGPCWQKLFALNCLAPDHSAICPATLSPPGLRHKAPFAYQWLLPPARGVVPRGAPRRAGRLGVPAFQEPPRTGVSAGGPGEARAVARGVGPHGPSRAAPAAGVLRHAARWGLSWRGRAWRWAPALPWPLRPGHRGATAAAKTCWAAATPAPRATG